MSDIKIDLLSVGNSTDNPRIHERVNKVIKESTDLVTALESVGAMYGIPSSHVLSDNTLNTIKVVGEDIIAPEKPNPSANTKAIMCGIGSVMDNISQRIDDKIDDFQFNNITLERLSTDKPSPSKGTVVARHTDDNGDEIISYDTGIVDMKDTPEARKKLSELRQQLAVPMYKRGQQNLSYFNDEDDLMAGINDNVGDDIDMTDVSDAIQESATYIDLMSMFNDTRTLGCDLLNSQGFDYVKPTSVVYTESTKSSKKGISVEDIKYLRFDNTNLLKAISYLNKARAEQSDVKRGKLDVDKFINNADYQKAIDCLNKQFNARLNIRYFSKDDYGNNLYTAVYDDIKNNLVLSKSKGFQLNGLPIEIHVQGTALDGDSPTDISLFGQSVISVFLHEIFHNIFAVLNSHEASFYGAFSVTMSIATGIRDGKTKRVFLSNYVNTLDSFAGLKMSKFKRRKLVKYLSVISSVQNSKDADKIVKNIESAGSPEEVDKYIDDLIRSYEKGVKQLKHQTSYRGLLPTAIIGTIIAGGLKVISLCMSNVEVANKLSIMSLSIAGLFCFPLRAQALTIKAYKQFLSEYNSGDKTIKEEYYCDLFAAMYKLPVTLFLPNKKGNRGIGITSNQVSNEKLKKLVELERKIAKLTLSSYPTIQERNFASVTVAKNLLENEQKSLDPSLKKYLEWIVDNYSSSLDTDIREIYNTVTFDPTEADNLDEHLNKLIKDHDVVLTESCVEEI